MDTTKLSWRIHAIKTIQQRETKGKFWRLGFFLTLTISFVICSILLINSLNFIEVNILLVDHAPFLLPLLVFTLLIGLYLALVSLINTSREFSTGAIELLLCGPVDELSFVLGEFFTQIVIFILASSIFLTWSLLCTWFLNLVFHWNLLAFTITTLVTTAWFIALGQSSAILGGKTRSSLILFFLILGGFAGIQVADSIITTFMINDSSTINDSWVFIRNTLSAINDVTQWISPFTLLQNSIRAIVDNRLGAYVIYTGILWIETLIFLCTGIIFLSKKGVR
jgi:ABC-type transport system involved in multi-copper enzyme maturation permease subunit